MLTYSGNGSGWVFNGSLTNISAVKGAGSLAPRAEVAIPLSEIGNPTNGSVVRFMFGVHCTNGSDFVQRGEHFPETSDHFNPSTWALLTYRNAPQWDPFGNTTGNSFWALNLSANFRYSFSAYAIDNSSNVGARSDTLVVQTSDRLGFNINGYVKSVVGVGIANAIVEEIEYHEISDATGYYLLHNLTNGSYSIYATYGNHISGSVWGNVSGADVNNVNMTLNNLNVTISNVSALYNVSLFQSVTIYPIGTDNDSDVLIWNSNGTSDPRVTFSNSTGQFAFISNGSDVGTYWYNISVDDGFGSTDMVNFSIAVGNVGPSILSNGTSRTFNVTYNVPSNATWYINGAVVQVDGSAYVHSYINSSPGNGIWNVSVVGSNEVGSVIKIWNWYYNISCGVVANVEEYVISIL